MPAIVLIVTLVLSVFATPSFAQTIDSEPNFAEHMLREHADLWASPFRVQRGDAEWLLPLGAGAAALLATDWRLSSEVKETEGLRPPSRFLSHFGGSVPLALASGTMMGIGKLTDNNKAVRTGHLALEAVLHSELLVRGIKMIVNRERPNKVDGQGQFWGGGRSFPSGHAATSFAFATVVADQYKDKKWVQVGAYGLATAVSLSRIGGRNHFPSDVLIGGVIGHLIGRYILNRHDNDE